MSKTFRITGWVLTVVLALLFTMSAFMKLSQGEEALKQGEAIGLTGNTSFIIGLVELGSLILFLIPRTGLLGGLLLIAYMGGAIATHLEHQQPIIIAVAVQVVVWIAVALRYPVLVQSVMNVRGVVSGK